MSRMEINFGRDSDQFNDALLALNNFDDKELKERANKYKEFLLSNNEKPTRAFCLLGRENNLLDDIEQIKNVDGNAFNNPQERNDYIKNFFENLYKKKTG